MISACILTKNSARAIRQCIEALKPAVDEIIVLDTGSYDETVSIVESLGLTVHHFKWVDSFSEARNHAHSLASHDWIFAVDSDEILHSDDVHKIRQVVAQADGKIVFGIVQVNRGAEGNLAHQHNTARIYNRTRSAWRYRAHEQLCVDAVVAIPQSTDIKLLHDGYDANVVSTYDKSMRNVKLLRLDAEQYPNDWDRHFFLGRDLLNTANAEEAVQHLLTACKLLESNGIASQHPSAYRTLAVALETSAQFDEAEMLTQRMTEWFPLYPDGHYMHSRLVIRRIEKLLKQAQSSMDTAKRTALSYSDIEVIDEAIGTWKGDMTLGDLAKLQGDLLTARKMYQSALESGGPAKPLSHAISRINTMLRSI